MSIHKSVLKKVRDIQKGEVIIYGSEDLRPVIHRWHHDDGRVTLAGESGMGIPWENTYGYGDWEEYVLVENEEIDRE